MDTVVTVDTPMIGAFAMIVIALWCLEKKKGLERILYVSGLSLMASTLLYPETPDVLLTFLQGGSASGSGLVVVALLCSLAPALYGFLRIVSVVGK